MPMCGIYYLQSRFSMLQYIRACFEEPTLQTTELQQKTTAIYTARFTQAIPNLMIHLRKCYITDELTADASAIRRWDYTCGVLKESWLFCWGKWVDIVMVKVRDLTKCLPQELTLEANIDYLMMVRKVLIASCFCRICMWKSCCPSWRYLDFLKNVGSKPGRARQMKICVNRFSFVLLIGEGKLIAHCFSFGEGKSWGNWHVA